MTKVSNDEFWKRHDDLVAQIEAANPPDSQEEAEKRFDLAFDRVATVLSGVGTFSSSGGLDDADFVSTRYVDPGATLTVVVEELDKLSAAVDVLSRELKAGGIKDMCIVFDTGLSYVCLTPDGSSFTCDVE